MIILLGFMGSGKSTLAKLISKTLGLTCIDLDDYIVNKEQQSIKSIFDKYGEKHFRHLEQKYLNQAILDKPDLLALGGGTPCHFDNMEIINEAGISIYIKWNIDELLNRLANIDDRPMLQDDTPKAQLIQQLLDIRTPHYESARIFYHPKNDTNHTILYSLITALTKNKQP